MYLESFLIFNFLKNKPRRRLNCLVALHLRVAKDKISEKIMKIKKGKKTFMVAKIKMQNQWSMTELKPDQVSANGLNTWKVIGEGGGIYDIRRQESVQQPCCEMKYLLCSICICFKLLTETEMWLSYL